MPAPPPRQEQIPWPYWCDCAPTYYIPRPNAETVVRGRYQPCISAPAVLDCRLWPHNDAPLAAIEVLWPPPAPQHHRGVTTTTIKNIRKIYHLPQQWYSRGCALLSTVLRWRYVAVVLSTAAHTHALRAHGGLWVGGGLAPARWVTQTKPHENGLSRRTGHCLYRTFRHCLVIMMAVWWTGGEGGTSTRRGFNRQKM